MFQTRIRAILYFIFLVTNASSSSTGDCVQQVFDKDRFSKDDAMGHAEFDIRPFLEAVKMNPQGVPEGTIIRKVVPCRQNCLAEESVVRWCHGQVTQDLALRLKDVERGEVELQLQWVNIPGAKGL